MKENESGRSNFIRRLYGGFHISWAAVILSAVGAAVLTAVFLIVPVFKDTSFHRMGVYLEAWIFFAVLIMANCEKPLESACKTFVFFLISQPLIYLLQVPFNAAGFGIFRYYRYWFLLTLFTFPAACIGWYIKKKNWLSLLILLPVLYLLTLNYTDCFRFTLNHFPLLCVTAVFCFAQVIIYLYVFTGHIVQKLAGFVLPLAAVFAMQFLSPAVQVDGTHFLPDNPVLSENAVIEDDSEKIDVTIEETGEDSMVRIKSTEYGTAHFVIHDGNRDYKYTLEIYLDQTRSTQVNITPDPA